MKSPAACFHMRGKCCTGTAWPTQSLTKIHSYVKVLFSDVLVNITGATHQDCIEQTNNGPAGSLSSKYCIACSHYSVVWTEVKWKCIYLRWWSHMRVVYENSLYRLIYEQNELLFTVPEIKNMIKRLPCWGGSKCALKDRMFSCYYIQYATITDKKQGLLLLLLNRKYPIPTKMSKKIETHT